MTVHSAAFQEELSWVLEPLLELARVKHALVASGDGILRGFSPDLERESREGVAAMMSSLQGAARTMMVAFSGNEDTKVRTVVIEDDADGYIFAAPAAVNTVLVVYGVKGVNLGEVAHHVQLQAQRLGAKVMVSQARDGASA
ncbi:roadblock/LC7 domain-containing protein [Streptomyces niveus]